MPSFNATVYVHSVGDPQVFSLNNHVLGTFGDPSLQIRIGDVAAGRHVGAAPRLANSVQGPLVLVAIALYALGWWGVRRSHRRARP